MYTLNSNTNQNAASNVHTLTKIIHRSRCCSVMWIKNHCRNWIYSLLVNYKYWASRFVQYLHTATGGLSHMSNVHITRGQNLWIYSQYTALSPCANWTDYHYVQKHDSKTKCEQCLTMHISHCNIHQLKHSQTFFFYFMLKMSCNSLYLQHSLSQRNFVHNHCLVNGRGGGGGEGRRGGGGVGMVEAFRTWTNTHLSHSR